MPDDTIRSITAHYWGCTEEDNPDADYELARAMHRNTFIVQQEKRLAELADRVAEAARSSVLRGDPVGTLIATVVEAFGGLARQSPLAPLDGRGGFVERRQ